MKILICVIVLFGIGCATDYNRKEWRHWTDDDHDCQSIRHEVLIATSLEPVTFKTEKECLVATGRWYDPYSGMGFTDATKLDIDHFVPLSNAHHSGGGEWTPERKRLYANDIESLDHLIPVLAKLNRQKGARGPDEWMPPNGDYACQYAATWVTIKMRWGLGMTDAERRKVADVIGACEWQNPSRDIFYLFR